MFRLKNPETKLPIPYPKVERKDPTVTDKGWDKVGDFTLREKIDFMPQKGLQEDLCACDANLIFICGSATSGKEQPYDAKIITPAGCSTMGELKVGDTICDTEGGTQKVLQIFEQGVKPVYKITLEDGGEVEAGLEHLWDVRISRWKKTCEYSTVTTRRLVEILKSRREAFGCVRNVFLPCPNVVHYDINPELTIKPYTLGALLGDGCFRTRDASPRIYTPDYGIIEGIKRDGYNIKPIPSADCGYVIASPEVKKALIDMGLWMHLSYDKFIPEQYLYADEQSRWELLWGLMDTDGTASGRCHAEYSTSSKRMAESVRQLVLSLGGISKIKSRKPTYTYKGQKMQGAESYRVYITFDNQQDAFLLERKKNCCSVRNEKYPNMRKIESIEYVCEKPCRCILVSNPNHLYITNDFIVTHNTYGMLLKVLQGIDKIGFTARFVSVRLQDSKKGGSIFRDGVEVLGNYAKCEYNSSDYPTFSWQQWNSNLQMIHSNFNVDNPTEWKDFQEYAKKNQASLIEFDEATDIRSFKMFSYFFSRNRDSSGMTPCTVLSFNPEHEHWTTQMLKDAGFLDDDWYLKPEMNGQKVYFYIKGDTPEGIIYGRSVEEVAASAGIVISDKEREAGVTEKSIIKSFTCFTGEAAGNLKLISATKGQVIGNLHAVGGTQRSILHGAYFGPVDNEELKVSRQMIHNMWENPQDDDENMYGTLDVSMGNEESDDCPFFIWKGLTIIAVEFIRTNPKELVDQIEVILKRYNIPVENFAFDSTGCGYYLTAYTNGVAITANRRPIQEVDEYGNPVLLEQYFNVRSQLLGKTRVLLETGKISTTLPKDLIIPYGKKGMTRRLLDVLFDEINVFRATTRNKKIYYRSKDEYKSKFHSSPDIMDSISLRAVFELDARPKKQPEAEIPEDAYNGFFQSYSGRAVWI